MKLVATFVACSLFLGLNTSAMPARVSRISIPLQKPLMSETNTTCKSDAGQSGNYKVQTDRNNTSHGMASAAFNLTTSANDTISTNGTTIGTAIAPSNSSEVTGDPGQISKVKVIIIVADGPQDSANVSSASNETLVGKTYNTTISLGQPRVTVADAARPRCAVASVKGQDLKNLESENRAIIAQKKARLSSLKGAASHIKVVAPTTVEVPLYWNVVTDGCKGHLDQSDIEGQIKVMNSDYKAAGYSFKLTNVTYVDRPDWFSRSYDASETEDMKKALRQGDGAKALNIYSVNFNDGTLGFATFPWDYSKDPKADGVVVQFNTVPGGGMSNYNGGRTVTHEVGHWLGLYHTFQGGCAAPGDYVDDTAPSASPTSGCPARRDSCSGDSLQDPIHNFMDYSYDSCMQSFTDGQIARMQGMSSKYRDL